MYHLLLLLQIVILVPFIETVTTCHPECVGQIDTELVCVSNCTAICPGITCQLAPHVLFGDSPIFPTPNCYQRCPPDQCEVDSCPVCEIVCDPLPGYQIECEMITCSWYCIEPDQISCPVPEDDEIVCDAPSCEASQEDIDLWLEEQANATVATTTAVISNSIHNKPPIGEYCFFVLMFFIIKHLLFS